MNLRNIALVACAVVSLTATLAAQQPVPGRRKAPSKAQSVTLTGCVAQGIDANHYVLANAVRREQPPSSTAAAGASKTVSSDKEGADDRTGPYDLEGGEFKAHLGHTVAVTGTSARPIKPTATAKIEAAESKPLPKFNVQSVKMISATCS